MREILLLGMAGRLVCAEPTDGGRRLTVADLQAATIIGRLGAPLGVVRDIEAEIVDGDSTRRMEHAGAYLLRVRSVDGTPMADRPLMRFAVAPGGDTVLDADHLARRRRLERASGDHPDQHGDPPADPGYVGGVHRLLAYEEGAFSGVPEGLPPDLVWQDHAFAFATRLVVVRQHDAPP